MSWLGTLQNLEAATLKVYRSNARAISFYARNGFAVASENPSPDLLLMHAKLAGVTARLLGGRPIPLGIVVPIRNEAAGLPRLLESLTPQLAESGVKVVAFVDGNSQDDSANIIRNWSLTWPAISLLQNPKEITPVAFNLGIRHCLDAGADAVMLLGGHSWVAADFLQRLQMRLAKTEADIIGAVHLYPEAQAPFQRVVQCFSESRLGRGLNRLSKLSAPTPTKVAFSPTIRRRVFDRIGLFDVTMIRNQDNDFTSRAQMAGFSIETDPALRYFYVPRSSLRALLRQMWGNGYWVGMRPAAHGFKYLAPMLFWSGLIGSCIVALFHPMILNLTTICVFAYLSALLLASAAQMRSATAICLAATFASAHCAYAGGTVAGLLHRTLEHVRKSQ
jgi:GT2 family glycosyltransferase